MSATGRHRTPRGRWRRIRFEASELEVVDVLRSDNIGRSEHHLSVGADGVVAEPTSGEFVAFLARDLALGERLRGVVGQVSKILDVPPDVLGRTVDDVLLHESGGSKPGQLDLVERTSLLQRARCRRQPDARRNDDALEVRETPRQEREPAAG